MSKISSNFGEIENLVHYGQNDFITLMKNVKEDENSDNQNSKNEDSFRVISLKIFLKKLFAAIDQVAAEIKSDDTILISVKNQKLLRTCFQFITYFGLSNCLIPGLGINLLKRSSSAVLLPTIILNDEQKYEILVDCTNFFTRSYSVPVLKNIILTLHLSDYLAALIQLAYAPLKKPGVYDNFTMTQELYDKLNTDRKNYVQVYNQLVSNCFQPMLMKELLVLQSVTDPSPPNFVKRIIAKEMSQRLLAAGGLLSLIRCFIENYDIDTAFEWRKIDMICRIITIKHGACSECDYLSNICSQLKQILCLNNPQYLATAVACVLCLNEEYSHAEPVNLLVGEVFQAFTYSNLTKHQNLPGTIILSPQEVEHKINILHACVCTDKLDWNVDILIPNLFMIFVIGAKCTKNDVMKVKLQYIIIKCLEKLNRAQLCETIKMFLFDVNVESRFLIEEYDAGVAVKSVQSNRNHESNYRLLYFLHLFETVMDNDLIQNIFEVSLKILIDLTDNQQKKANKDMLLIKEDPILLDDTDQKYAIILQLLSEMSTSTKINAALKMKPGMVFDFIEHFILKQGSDTDNECCSIALVLLNTLLMNSSKTETLGKRFSCLVPVLEKISKDELSLNSILCKDILSLLNNRTLKKTETAYGKAMVAIFDNMLPVRAHGIMELTKLIDAKDAETLSKKHYIFCLFQELLKDEDSYIYLSAVNGLSSLCTCCPEDVLHVLCKEFLQLPTERVQTRDSQNNLTEKRLKVGDVIVKVTKRLGEMAVVHKTILLNTMLCGCRDDDPHIRTSALSNLAEIALVLNYKMGTIIYEVLFCILSILETDKAIECRRAAVMVISSLIKGLGKETLVQLKENLLPIYRKLKELYKDDSEDSAVRLHAQIALDELNDVVSQFLFPEVTMVKQIFVLDEPQDVFK